MRQIDGMKVNEFIRGGLNGTEATPTHAAMYG